MIANWRSGHFEIHPARRRLTVDGEPVTIGARAFDVLIALVERSDRTVRTAELLDVVWPGLVVEENNLQVQISALRKVLGRDAIATIPGRGYRFTLTSDAVARAPAAGDTVATAPALDLPRAKRTNVPAPPQALLGREADIAALLSCVEEQRLVVILGPGGIGKTRVAQVVARQRVGAHADGIWWIDLSTLSAASSIAPAIAAAAQLQLGSGDDSTALLIRAIGERDLLLVLDNCERLATEIARLVQRALNATGKLRILATSQEALRCESEHRYRLDALAVPPAGCALDEARAFAALQLLEQRAQAVNRRFELTNKTVASARELCRHLDGNALAIEMAAARLPVLGADALNARLVDRLRLLNMAARDVPARQQSLQATLDWSHSLLSPNAQVLFRRLSSFAGSFRFDVAQWLAQGPDLDEWAVLDAVGELLDKSLLQLDQEDPPRIRLLESARLYAGKILASAGEAGEIDLQHGRAMQRLADEAEQAFWTEPEDAWLERYRFDYDNLELAFERACGWHSPEVAAATAEILGRIDTLRSINTFVRARMDAAYELLRMADPRTKARLWDCVVSHRVVVSTAVPRLDSARERAAAWRALGEPKRMYRAQLRLAVEWAVAGDMAASSSALAEARALEDPHWPARLRFEALSHESMVAVYRGDALLHMEIARKKLHLAERAGAVREAARARSHMADAALMAGDVPRAINLGREAISALQALDQPGGLGVALANLCSAYLIAGDVASAIETASRAWPLMIANESGPYLFDRLALIAARVGAHEVSARLLGASDARFERDGAPRQPNELRVASLAAQGSEAALGAMHFVKLKAEGARFSLTESFEIAQELLGGMHRGRERSAQPDRLADS